MTELENIFNLNRLILLPATLMIILGLTVLVMGLIRLTQRRLLISGLQTLSGTSLLFAGLLLISMAINLYTYQRLTHEEKIAELTFNQLSKQNFNLTMTLFNSNTKHRYSISGDEWQIDARVIKWQGWAQLLGLTAQYRLERLSGRYTDIEQEKQQARKQAS